MTPLLLTESALYHAMKYTSSDKEPPNNNDNTSKKGIFHLSIFHFSRSSADWKERCVLVADTPTDKPAEKELIQLLDTSQQCTMICFLKTSQTLTKESWNPLRGYWISVAKTPQRCKEHVTNENISKKSFVDYYTMELGDELNHAGDYVSRKTLSPITKSTQKYIDSWKNGDQQSFFNKFWNSLRNGDAFYLLKDSTKRLFDNYKEPSDKK